MTESPYDAEHVHRALALEPTVGAPELQVQAVGDHLVVTGTVQTPERLRAIDALLSSRFSEHRIENHVEVAAFRAHRRT